MNNLVLKKKGSATQDQVLNSILDMEYSSLLNTGKKLSFFPYSYKTKFNRLPNSKGKLLFSEIRITDYDRIEFVFDGEYNATNPIVRDADIYYFGGRSFAYIFIERSTFRKYLLLSFIIAENNTETLRDLIHRLLCILESIDDEYDYSPIIAHFKKGGKSKRDVHNNPMKIITI